MKTKFLLPVLALIFAVGMSFTTLSNSSENYATKYVHDGTMWHQIEVDCQTGTVDCKVIFSEDPTETPYPVYNSQSFNNPVKGSEGIKRIPGPAPSN